MNQQPRRSNSFVKRVRKLSNTVMNIVTGRPQDPRFGYQRYGASHSSADLSNQPPRDEWKRYNRGKARSTEDIVYRPWPQASQPSTVHWKQPSVQDMSTKPKTKSHSRALEMRYGPQDGPSRNRAGPSRSNAPVNAARPPNHPTGSRDHPRKKERPVPVPLLDYTQRRPEASGLADGYQFPPRPSPTRDSEIYTHFLPPPRSPALSAAWPDSPTLGVLPHSFGGLSASTRGPRAAQRVGPSPLARPPTDKGKPSVYCSTDTPTVRRHGAIRRTSSSGEITVPLPIQHARHCSDRKDEPSTPSSLQSRHNTTRPSTPPTPRERERQRQAPGPTLQRTTQRQPPPSSPLRPVESIRERNSKARLPEVKPRTPDVPRDIDSEIESFLGTETPRSSLMLIPPAPIATTSVVAKLQGTMFMHMRESSSARPVKTVVGGGDLHRAQSYKAEVVEEVRPEYEGSPRSTEPESTVGAVVECEGGRSEKEKWKETVRARELKAAEKRAGVAAWVASLSKEAHPEGNAPLPPPLQRAGTLPLNIRKKNGAGVGAQAAAPSRR